MLPAALRAAGLLGGHSSRSRELEEEAACIPAARASGLCSAWKLPRQVTPPGTGREPAAAARGRCSPQDAAGPCLLSCPASVQRGLSRCWHSGISGGWETFSVDSPSTAGASCLHGTAPPARPPGETGTGGSPQSQQAALTQEVAGGWLSHVRSVSARSQGGAPSRSRGDHPLPVVLESGSPCSAQGLAFCAVLGEDRSPEWVRRRHDIVVPQELGDTGLLTWGSGHLDLWLSRGEALLPPHRLGGLVAPSELGADEDCRGGCARGPRRAGCKLAGE